MIKKCPNKECGSRMHVIKYGVQPNGIPRYKCKACGKTYSQTKNTFRYYSHLSKNEIVSICKMIADKMSYRGIARKTHKHLDTIRSLKQRIKENQVDFKKNFKKYLTRKEYYALLKRLRFSKT